MTTIRVAKRKRFTAISRDAINDERLSFRARGVLAWLLDKPDDWSVNSDTISRSATEGRDAVRTALNELAQAGYIIRTKHQADHGHWVTETVVHETPPTTDSQASDGRLENRPSVNRASDSQAPLQRLLPKTVTNPLTPNDENQRAGDGDPHPSDGSPPVDRKRMAELIREGKKSLKTVAS